MRSDEPHVKGAIALAHPQAPDDLSLDIAVLVQHVRNLQLLLHITLIQHGTLPPPPTTRVTQHLVVVVLGATTPSGAPSWLHPSCCTLRPRIRTTAGYPPHKSRKEDAGSVSDARATTPPTSASATSNLTSLSSSASKGMMAVETSLEPTGDLPKHLTTSLLTTAEESCSIAITSYRAAGVTFIMACVRLTTTMHRTPSSGCLQSGSTIFWYFALPPITI
mmetsp:Transcript_27082/g.65897  ORF Transcript_27082/g.65897 Transcript_27082/m.65897 type:complete len:220 (-) Transcript_27082:1603-2262(-)